MLFLLFASPIFLFCTVDEKKQQLHSAFKLLKDTACVSITTESLCFEKATESELKSKMTEKTLHGTPLNWHHERLI